MLAANICQRPARIKNLISVKLKISVKNGGKRILIIILRHE